MQHQNNIITKKRENLANIKKKRSNQSERERKLLLCIFRATARLLIAAMKAWHENVRVFAEVADQSLRRTDVDVFLD